MLSIATRFFGKDPGKDLPRLARFIEAGLALGKVHVAVNVAEDKCDTLAFCAKEYPNADAFAVTPWGKFVPPLNALVDRASLSSAHGILIASAEFPPSREAVELLGTFMHAGTLVVGARFSEHAFKEGENENTGSTVPWNTFALWNMAYLARLGFPLVGDAAFDRSQAGVEEVSAVALYQKLYGVSAKLVSVAGFYEEWNMDGWDEERKKKHLSKIASKVSRPNAQLARLGLPAGRVLHIA
jgi:hypothetical protein